MIWRVSGRNAARTLLLVCVSVGTPHAQAERDPFAGHIAQTDPLTPEEQQKKFRLPPGFEIQLVAAEPEIQKPINLAFDHRNRLWVTTTVEYPFPAKDLEKARDRLTVIEDTTGDGRGDTFTTFADRLNIPIGVLPTLDGAIVWSIPHIWKLTDTTGDGVADRREPFIGPFDHRDTHGNLNAFTWGFDGWIYLCHGFANHSQIAGEDGHQIDLWSGNTFRMRPDGSRVEHVTRGQVNPFGLMFDPLGNMYTADCHTRPVYQLLPGARYPRQPDDGLGFGPETCDHEHGSTAISGICVYSADHFPEEYRNTVFTGNVITIKLDHDRLERSGASYRAVHLPEFLACDDPWFRPVDIQQGPDGAMYIADFYNRVIGHYEVPLDHPARDKERGRIWRVVYRGPDGDNPLPVPPRDDFSKATVKELIEDLAHPNLVVRKQATNQLADRIGKAAVDPVREAMQSAIDPWTRAHGLWVLHRADGLDRETLAAMARAERFEVRVHAQRVLGEREMGGFERDLVHEGLRDPDAFVQMAAADALRRQPHPSSLIPLLECRGDIGDDDPKLRHTVRMALREQLNLHESWARYEESPDRDRFAPFVLDVAPGVHDEKAAALVLQQFKEHPPQGDVLRRHVEHIGQFGSPEVIRDLVGFVRTRYHGHREAEELAIGALQQGLARRGDTPTPELRAWAETVVNRLIDEGLYHHALTIVRATRLKNAEEQVVRIALWDERNLHDRRLACRTLIDIGADDRVAILTRIVEATHEPDELREHAASLLRGADSDGTVEVLGDALQAAPSKLAGALAHTLASTRSGSERLLEEVAAGRASPRLLVNREVQDQVRRHEIPDADDRIAELTRRVPSLQEDIAALMEQRRKGFAEATTDVQAGARVFETTCSACHRIGDVGQPIGPELDGIGVRGLDRLLEDTLDPSQIVDQAYRTTNVQLYTGAIYSGLLLPSEGEVIRLANALGDVIELPRDDIDDMWQSSLSPMPSNIAEDLTDQEFYDLMAFLLAQRADDTAASDE